MHFTWLVLIFSLPLVKQCHLSLKGQKRLVSKENSLVFVWNATMNEFISLNGRNLSDYLFKRQTQPYSLKNTTINVLAYDMEPYVKVYQNNSLSGFLGDTWHLLEEYLGFKSNISSAANYNFGIEQIQENKADVCLAAVVYYKALKMITFSHPYFFTWYHLYFKVPEGKPPAFLHFKVFSTHVWLSIVCFFLLISILLWLSCKLLNHISSKAEHILSLPTYFIGIISAFLNTGYDLHLKSASTRLQIFFALFFGTLCYYALCASLVARLAVLEIKMPFEELQDLSVKNTHSMCIRNISFVYNNFTDENKILLPQWEKIVNTNKCLDIRDWRNIVKIICNERIVILENRIIMSLVIKENLSCAITSLPQKYFKAGNYIALSRQFKGYRALDLAMHKLRSAGILQKLEDKWVKANHPTISLTAGGNNITYSHASGLILIYFLMILFSLFVLALEIFYKKTMEHQKYAVKNHDHWPYNN